MLVIDIDGTLLDPEGSITAPTLAAVLRDGRLLQGRWQRPTVDAPRQLSVDDGSRLTLRPGRTWVELPPRPNRSDTARPMVSSGVRSA